MEFNSSDDIIFDNIIEQIKAKMNIFYQCKIIKEIMNNNVPFKIIKLSIDEEESESFIVNENTENLTGKMIKFYVNSLKIRIINNRPYFFIQKYKLENNNIENKNNLLMNLESNLYKIITSIEKIEKKSLYTLILKAREIKVKSQQYEFQFEDSNKNIVAISGLENVDIENGKIYCFNGYNYNSLYLKFEPTCISNIEELSPKTLRIYNSKEILESKENSLLNFQGKVKTFNIENNIITIEDENSKIYKVNANYHLIKQLSLNAENKFYNFYKKNDKEFIYSNLSFVEGKEETFIEFNFPLYDFETKYYNKIKINEKYYDINNKRIKIPVEDKNKNIIFSQKIIYEKITEEKILDSYSVDLDVDKGKTYHLTSSIEKNDFSYEFFIQSIKEENLPKNINIKIKDKIINIEPDKNYNKLKERFSVINIPKQSVETIFNLSDKDNSIDDKHNFKYLLMIDNNNIKTLKKFEKSETTREKIDFYISKETENKLEKASKQCYINFIEDNKDKLYNVDKNDANIFVNLIGKLVDGFRNFNFQNTKRHYKIIKNITSFCINYCYDLFLGKYYSLRKNYEILLDSMLNLEYIDRIKILITFMKKLMDTAVDENENIFYEMFHLIDVDNDKSYELFSFVKDAFDVFYKIIDELTEDCPFFKAIDQFNSLIYKDVISSENQHSGSILNLNDIKLEIVKNMNRFIFLSEKSGNSCNDYADFEPSGLLVTIYMFSFTEDEKYIFDEKNYKKATSAVLFLLFHECLGHQKKNINNENAITPRKHHKNDFKEFICEGIDTGTALEMILLEKKMNISYLMKSNNSEKLLDPNLYTGKDFSKLQSIYLSIENDIINKKNNNIEIDERNNKIKSMSQNKTKLKMKEHHLMYYDLIRVFSGISEEEKKNLKDNEDYQRFLRMYKRRHQKPSEYMKIPDILTHRFNNKK